MSIERPGVQPGSTGQAGNVPGHQPNPKGGRVSGSDAEDFDSAMAGGEKNEAEEELTPEEELRNLIKKSSMEQFITRSQELTQETKKNFEG